MAKKKKKTKLERFVEAAEELNEVLGLEPQIETEDTDINTLASKMREASELIMEDDHFTKGTEKVLEYITVDEEPEEEDEEVETEEAEEEDADEPETEDKEPAEEAEGVSPSELREQVEACGKRKELLRIAMGEDFFAPLESKLPELKSEDALRGAMLKLLDEAIGDEEEETEEPEEEVEETSEAEEAPEEKPKKKTKAKKAPKKKSGAKSLTQQCRDFLEDLIEEGSYDRTQLIDAAADEFEDLKKATISVIITDSKNPKYNKYESLVIEEEDGTIRFEE